MSYYEAHTLIGGRLLVEPRVHSDNYLGTFDVLSIDHEDGVLELTEDEAFNLIGALSMRLVEARRRRQGDAPPLRERDVCDSAYLAARPCPLGPACRRSR